MEYAIRKARLEDLPVLLRFEQGVISTERPFDSTLKDDPNTYYDIPGMIAADHIELLVAELHGEVVACGYARIEDSKSYLRHPQHAYLGFMYVVPEHRGKGVNRIILEALEQWSRAQGIVELRLDVYVQNARAIQAYTKAGFGKYMMSMRKGL